MVEQLTPHSLDVGVWGSSLAGRIVSLAKELYSTLCLFTQVYKWVPVTYCWGVTLAILLGMFHAKETRISSSRLGLWLVCALTFLPSYLA